MNAALTMIVVLLGLLIAAVWAAIHYRAQALAVSTTAADLHSKVDGKIDAMGKWLRSEFGKLRDAAFQPPPAGADQRQPAPAPVQAITPAKTAERAPAGRIDQTNLLHAVTGMAHAATPGAAMAPPIPELAMAELGGADPTVSNVELVAKFRSLPGGPDADLTDPAAKARVAAIDKQVASLLADRKRVEDADHALQAALKQH